MIVHIVDTFSIDYDLENIAHVGTSKRNGRSLVSFCLKKEMWIIPVILCICDISRILCSLFIEKWECYLPDVWPSDAANMSGAEGSVSGLVLTGAVGIAAVSDIWKVVASGVVNKASTTDDDISSTRAFEERVEEHGTKRRTWFLSWSSSFNSKTNHILSNKTLK